MLWRTQANFRIHVLMALTAWFLAWQLRISGSHFALIVLSSVLVLAAEAFNTALEFTLDHFSPHESWPAKWAKDAAAAAVLITALGALITGLVILGPPLYERLVKFL